MLQGNRAPEITHGTVDAVSDEDQAQQRDHRTCTRRGCARPALDDADYCGKHDADIKRYKREYRDRQYAEWLASGRCTRCGARERKKGSNWCPGCLIRLQKLPGLDQERQLDHSARRERIAARLIPWSNSPQNEGRLRLRGGKRGAPSAESRDRRDLRDIRRVLDRYEKCLDEAYSAETQGMLKIQRDDTVKAAHAGLALAVRLGMEALVTYGYECPVLAEDFEPEEVDHVDEIVKSGR